MCYPLPEAMRLGPTHPEDILQGYPVGAGLFVYCTGCYDELRSGAEVTVYAYRMAGSLSWDVPRVYCADCAPAEIETPTLGAIEVLADARLATQSRPDTQTHQLCVVEPQIIDEIEA